MRRALVWGMELVVYYVLWLVLVKPMVVYYVLFVWEIRELLTYYGY